MKRGFGLFVLVSGKMDITLPLPKDPRIHYAYRVSKAVARIELVGGLYHYIPRKHTFARGIILGVEELEVIVDTLKDLNKSL